MPAQRRDRGWMTRQPLHDDIRRRVAHDGSRRVQRLTADIVDDVVRRLGALKPARPEVPPTI